MKVIRRTDLDADARDDFLRMRRTATALLALMAVAYVLARSFEESHWTVGFARAFAEAAMVGGLADWFAVTALFRHPLGLPIPHTAIIPRKKDQIGDTLARFLKDNFLVPQVIARRMAALDLAGSVGNFLVHQAGSQGRLREGAARLFGDMLEVLDTERIGGMVRAGMKRELERFDFAPLVGKLIESATEEGRVRPVLDDVIAWGARLLDQQQHYIYDIVHERANTILRLTGLDEKIAASIVKGLHRLLSDLAENPDHPLRLKGEEALARFAWRLQHDPVMQARAEAWKAELIANPALGDFLVGFWENLRERMLAASRDPDKLFDGQIGEIIAHLGRTLEQEDRLKVEINRFARRAAVGTAAAYGDAIVTLISETVRGWDAETVTGRVEQAVGRDLQFIRINGTLVGGCVGLTLHAIGMLF